MMVPCDSGTPTQFSWGMYNWCLRKNPSINPLFPCLSSECPFPPTILLTCCLDRLQTSRPRSAWEGWRKRQRQSALARPSMRASRQKRLREGRNASSGFCCSDKANLVSSRCFFGLWTEFWFHIGTVQANPLHWDVGALALPGPSAFTNKSMSRISAVVHTDCLSRRKDFVASCHPT